LISRIDEIEGKQSHIDLLNKEIQSLTEQLQKAKIESSKFAYEADRAKRDRDNAERESILLREKLKQYNQNEV
jgi:hypothetical protein